MKNTLFHRKKAASVDSQLAQDRQVVVGEAVPLDNTCNPYHLSEDVIRYGRKISSVLVIDPPPVMVVDCLYTIMGYTIAQKTLNPKEIPSGAEFIGGNFNHENNVIVLARKTPVFPIHHSAVFRQKSDAALVFALAHEYRHVWQRRYKPDKYYRFNAAGFEESVKDIAEVDADAFAIAFVFSAMTGYQDEDCRDILPALSAMTGLDHDARLNLAYELAEQYHFGKVYIHHP